MNSPIQKYVHIKMLKVLEQMYNLLHYHLLQNILSCLKNV